MMNENIKKLAINGSAIALALAMGLQTFIFGHNDIQKLKESITQLSERMTKLETPASLETPTPGE
jgi:hypothetical protein